MTSQFPDITSPSNLFDVVLFLLWSLVNGPSFMLISSLVLELWQFSFIRDWPEIRKSETLPSEFCPIFGDWDKLGIRNLTRVSLIKCYWMAQNAIYRFWVIKGKPIGEEGGRVKLSTSSKLGLIVSIFPLLRLLEKRCWDVGRYLSCYPRTTWFSAMEPLCT